MKIDFDPKMLDASPLPIMLIDADACLNHANAAALPLMPVFLKGRALWAGEIARARRGEAALPRRLEVAATFTEAQAWEIWLTSTDGRYALVFAGLLPEPRHGGLPGEFALIGESLRSEIRGFADSVRRIEGTLLNTRELEQRGDMLSRATWLVEILDELTRLSELHAGNPLKDEERVFLYPLVTALAGDLRRADGRPGPWDIDPAGAGVAPLYGRRDWLVLAIRACMQRLMESCPDDARARVELRQVGDFALLSGSVGPRAPRGFDSGIWPRGNAEGMVRFNLDLDVAERIFEIHGGQVRLRRLDRRDSLESFTVALPTAHPHGQRSIGRCEECPVARQAMEYARELATLL